MSFKNYLKEMLEMNGETIEGLIERIKENPKLHQYVTDGEYDEVQVEIPLVVLQKTFGIGEEELKEIENNTEEYEGWMMIDNGIVSLGGGA